MTYTKENPKVVRLSELKTGGILFMMASGSLKKNEAYFCMVSGVPTKIVK